MKKVLIIGCPGGGKSSFARELHRRTSLPLCHLDMLFWNADKTTVSRETLCERVREVIGGDEWIIDGNYSATLPMRLEACDTVFFLDMPTELCLEGVRRRRGQVRPDMPWIETEEDPEFQAKSIIAEGKPIPRIYHTCGSEDFLVERAHYTRDFFLGFEGNPFDYNNKDD